MERRVAIVTGGLRGLGRAMAFGLMREGHSVLAVGHIDADVAEIESATVGANFPGRILPLVADLRRPAECDRVVAVAQERLGTPADPRQQRRSDLHDDRPGAVPPPRAAEILAGAGRHRAKGHRDQLHRRRPDVSPCRA
jgi:NAD(P)-dependent dehydrogenase (short-subunit alcohol dehydrogenase family)